MSSVRDLSFLSKSRFETCRFPVVSIVNERSSVFTGNVYFSPVISESGTASTTDTDPDISIKIINSSFIMQQQKLLVFAFLYLL